MTHRFRRSAMVVALVAGTTTTATLFDVSTTNAASVPFLISTSGETGTIYIDALWGPGLCGGTSPLGGYDAGWNWDAAGNLTPKTPYFNEPDYTVPTLNSGCPSQSLSLLRLELYPRLNDYDPWDPTHVVGGAHSQRQKSIDGPIWNNFGVVPLPTLGVTPAGGQYPGFRMTGNIISSTAILDKRLIVDLFQVPCSYPDFCVLPPVTNTGAYVGGFTTGRSNGAQWTGSVSWPGRYQVYIKDCAVGWEDDNTCNGQAHGEREIRGFVDISDGNVPTWDLDAPCFGILNCSYDVGGLTTPTGGFHPLPPTRILDTRAAPIATTGITNGAIRRGDGRLPLNLNPVHRVDETANHDLKVTGIGGIPAYGVSAVLLNVTAVNPASADWLSVFPRPPSFDIFNNQGSYPAGDPATTSNLNMSAGVTAPNMVLARVGAGGTIRFWNATFAGMHVIADVAGWFDTGATPPIGGPALRFTGIAPQRLMDTRVSTPDPLCPCRIQAGESRELLVSGIPGIPADAESVVLNITSAAPTAVGYVTAYPSLTPLPNASNLNVSPGITRSNMAVVKVGTDHKIRLAVLETDMDLIVDITGYYGPSGGLTTIIDPVRAAVQQFGPGQTQTVQLAGTNGIPSNATAVILNVTAANTDAWGWLTVWPGGAQPGSSSINWPGGRNTPNMVMIGLDRGGSISIYNDLGNATVLVDVFGYVT